MGLLQDLFRRPGDVTKRLFNFNVIQGSTNFNTYGTEKEKLAAALSNPAFLKVLSLQCDLFSLAKVYVYDQDKNELEQDEFLKWFRRPNPFQSQSQFLWDAMFWQMLGTSYAYLTSNNLSNPLLRAYHLDPAKIEWPQWLEQERDHLALSSEKLKRIMDAPLVYRYDNGVTLNPLIQELIITHDMTNGIGNWLKSPSRVDALYKVIANSEEALNSKNINVRYAGKFLVGSDSGTDRTPLMPEEKENIKEQMESDKQVFPTAAMVYIRRFVENMKVLELGSAYLEDYFIIGSMYGIPRDVLEAYQSSTFENQEQARAGHVAYTLDPKGNDWVNQYEDHFGYTDQGKNIVLDWSHLPFMQVFQKTQAEQERIKFETMKIMLELGYTLEEAKRTLDIQ
jgi:hypothetical protein